MRVNWTKIFPTNVSKFTNMSYRCSSKFQTFFAKPGRCFCFNQNESLWWGFSKCASDECTVRTVCYRDVFQSTKCDTDPSFFATTPIPFSSTRYIDSNSTYHYCMLSIILSLRDGSVGALAVFLSGTLDPMASSVISNGFAVLLVVRMTPPKINEVKDEFPEDNKKTSDLNEETDAKRE